MKHAANYLQWILCWFALWVIASTGWVIRFTRCLLAYLHDFLRGYGQRIYDREQLLAKRLQR